MARNDGIDRTFARNQDLPTLDDVAKVQEHNEREKDSYSNQDIDTTQTYRNIHFKAPTDSYAAMFDQLIADGIISTRGLKADAVKYGELIFDVNSAYFHNHGGYEYAKQFYTDAYKAAVEIVGGEQYILSAVMHADERNRAMLQLQKRSRHLFCPLYPGRCTAGTGDGAHPCGQCLYSAGRGGFSRGMAAMPPLRSGTQHPRRSEASGAGQETAG